MSTSNLQNESRDKSLSDMSNPRFRSVTLDQRPTLGLASPPTLSKPSITIQSNRFSQKASSSSLWNVTELKTIPEDYNLPRTSRLIINTEVSTICSRIVNCMKNLGIEAHFDAKKAEATCETIYFVKFSVCLHQGKGDYSHGIIVEVKRTLGGCIEFMADCRAILKAAQGDSTIGKFQLGPRKSISEMNCLKNCDEILRNASKYASEALECSEKYLQDDRDDMKILGLSSVNSLLDKNTCSCETLKLVYKSVFTGEINPGIRSSVRSFLEKKFDPNTSDEHRRKLHFLSIQVIYNSFYVCRTMCREGCKKALKENPWLTDSLTKTLVNDIKEIMTYPLACLWSLKCLNEMVPLSEEVKKNALNCGLLGAAEKACEVGKVYCERLRCEAQFLENLVK